MEVAVRKLVVGKDLDGLVHQWSGRAYQQLMGNGADGGAERIWADPGGWGSNWDGAVVLSSGVYETEISAACLLANSCPFLSHRAEEEGEAGICCLRSTHSSYKQPLCPLALAKLLALLLLATACSACAASWPCLSWMTPAKKQGSSPVHQFTSCFASFTDWDRLWWCLLRFSCACTHILYSLDI